MLLNAARALIVAVLLAASAGAEELPRDGDYLSADYLARLEKTKSHRKAWGTAGAEAITVSRNNRGVVSLLIGNWHEGNWANFDPQNPLQKSGVEGPFVWIDANHFIYGSGKDEVIYYFVGKAETYIAQKLLVGTFADARGRQYEFGRDGVARLPGKTFRYEIYTDMVFEPCDEFLDLDTTKQNEIHATGFRWRGSKLYLYKLDCNSERSPGCVMEKKPLAVLHRLKAKK